jgi:hypothetical protein
VAVAHDDLYMPYAKSTIGGLQVAVVDRAASWSPSPSTTAARQKVPYRGKTFDCTPRSGGCYRCETAQRETLLITTSLEGNVSAFP